MGLVCFSLPQFWLGCCLLRLLPPCVPRNGWLRALRSCLLSGVTTKWWTEDLSILQQVKWFIEVFPSPQLLGLCTQWMFLNALLNVQQYFLSDSGLCDGQGWIWLWESCSARTGINIHLAAPAHLAFWVAYSVVLKQRGSSSFPKSHAYKPAISIAQSSNLLSWQTPMPFYVGGRKSIP